MTWKSSTPPFRVRRAVVFANRRGETPEQIGAAHGMTPTRVRWVLWREGERPQRQLDNRILAFLDTAPCPQAVPWIVLALRNPEDYRRGLNWVKTALQYHRRLGTVVSRRYGTRQNYWALARRMPMNLDQARELVLRGARVPEILPDLETDLRPIFLEWFVRSDEVAVVRAREHAASQTTRTKSKPEYTGHICPNCQGTRLRRAGTCLICDDCFLSQGCD